VKFNFLNMFISECACSACRRQSKCRNLSWFSYITFWKDSDAV